MVAAVTLQYVDPFRTGKLVLYQVKYTRGWHGFELIPFCLLGVLGVSTLRPAQSMLLTLYRACTGQASYA